MVASQETLQDPKTDPRERCLVTNVFSPANLFYEGAKSNEVRVSPISREAARQLVAGKRAIVLPGSVYHAVRDKATGKMHALIPQDVWPIYRDSLGVELYSGAEEADAQLPLKPGSSILLGELQAARQVRESKVLLAANLAVRWSAEVVWSLIEVEG